MRRKILFILSLILLIVAFGLYTFSEDNVLANLRLFTQVLSQVESKYVEEVDKAKLIAAATEGLMIPLDPFCQILVSDDNGDFPSGNNGVYEKYGLAFTLDNGVPAIGAPIYGSPAYQQGIKAGDTVIRINGKIYRNKSLSEVLEHMEIEPGDTLKLSIIPVDERGSIVYEFTEDAEYYTEEAVPAGISWKDYGYISLKRLSVGTSATFKDELTALNDKKALILDLRDCPNGSVQEAIAIADLFLPKGSIITQISSRNYDIIQKETAQHPPIFSEKPLVILANQGTFGAAEIIASALSDHNIGVVIGERTAGKTGIQEVMPVSTQYAVELTTKEYLTPNEESLLIEYEEKEDGEKEVAKEPGLEPNLEVN
jgi:carboxyl-terminal processing protease